MSDFLVFSLIASVVLTVVLNVLPRLFPGLGRRAERALRTRLDAIERGDEPRVRVFFPWKAMLLASLVLTIVINVVAYVAGR